jgi:hypothetical protein
MASIGKLVATVAQVEGIEEGTVKLIARYLREEGYISQGSHGPAAAMMSARDAARLLIGVNASSTATGAVKAVTAFGKLRLVQDFAAPEDPAEAADLIDADDRIGQAMRLGTLFEKTLSVVLAAHVPDAKGRVSIDPDLSIAISFSRPIERASIRMIWPSEDEDKLDEPMHLAEFGDYERSLGWVEKVPDRSDTTTITKTTLRAVGQVLAT